MNDFRSEIKEKAKVSFSSELISLMEGILRKERTLKEVCDTYGGKGDIPKDVKTLRIRIEQFAGENREFCELYMKYRENLSKRPRGYSYMIEVLDMLENDLSQRDIATAYSINRNTLKDAIKRIREIYPDLNIVVEEHVRRHHKGKREEMTCEQRKKVLDVIDKYKLKYDVDCMVKQHEELSEKALNTILEEVYYLERLGYSQYEISQEIGIAVSTIRSYKAKKLREEKIKRNEWNKGIRKKYLSNRKIEILKKNRREINHGRIFTNDATLLRNKEGI